MQSPFVPWEFPPPPPARSFSPPLSPLHPKAHYIRQSRCRAQEETEGGNTVSSFQCIFCSDFFSPALSPSPVAAVAVEGGKKQQSLFWGGTYLLFLSFFVITFRDGEDEERGEEKQYLVVKCDFVVSLFSGVRAPHVFVTYEERGFLALVLIIRFFAFVI